MLTKTPLRVHIIDDSKDIQALLRLVLEAKGYQVDCSFNGADALSDLQSHDGMPDVILLDSIMPIMSGQDFLQKRRDIPRLKAVPVIMMSGDYDGESKHENFSREISATLKKPFGLSAVIEMIEGQCARS